MIKIPTIEIKQIYFDMFSELEKTFKISIEELINKELRDLLRTIKDCPESFMEILGIKQTINNIINLPDKRNQNLAIFPINQEKLKSLCSLTSEDPQEKLNEIIAKALNSAKIENF